MRRHLELGLSLAALGIALAGAACSREADRRAEYPQARPVPVSYSEANETSTSSLQNVPKAGVGYDSMEKAEGAAMPQKSSSSTMDNGAYDQSGVPNTGSTANVPSGIGGGPADKTFKPGSATDDNADTSLTPDKGKDTSEAKPSSGKAKGSGGKSSSGKSGTTGSGGAGGGGAGGGK